VVIQVFHVILAANLQLDFACDARVVNAAAVLC